MKFRAHTFAASLAFLAAVMTTEPAAAQDKIEMSGLVISTNGTPITNATIVVWAAKPREGSRTVCASCYPDCGKTARSSGRGTFSFEDLDPELIFRLLVRAPGFRPQFVNGADPFGAAPRASMKPLLFADAPAPQRAIAKVIGTDGMPVLGAVFDVQGTSYGSYTSYGGARGADSTAATDESGVFAIGCSNDVIAISGILEAPKLARRRVSIEIGKAHLLRMTEGVTVTGRITQNGKPLPNIPLAMGTQIRDSSKYMDGFDGTTDSEGKFQLQNVPPNNQFWLHTKMKSMRNLGVALGLVAVTTGADGRVVNLGDIEAKPSATLRGRVVLTDGKPIPARARIYFGLDDANDGQDIRLPEDGAFEFLGIPTGSKVSLSVRIPNYRVSAKNPSKDWLNEGRLVGTLAGDLEDFLIQLEPGERSPRGMVGGSDRQPSNEPLRSATP